MENLSLIKYLMVLFLIISPLLLLSCNSSQITNAEQTEHTIIQLDQVETTNSTETDDLWLWRNE